MLDTVNSLPRLFHYSRASLSGTSPFPACHDSCTKICTGLTFLPERIQYKIGVTVHRCLHSKAPKYLTDCCTPVSDIASRRHLRSASRHHLYVRRYRLSTCRCRAFSVAGPTVWNYLPGSLRDPALSSSSFRQLPETDIFNRYSA